MVSTKLTVSSFDSAVCLTKSVAAGTQFQIVEAPPVGLLHFAKLPPGHHTLNSSYLEQESLHTQILTVS